MNYIEKIIKIVFLFSRKPLITYREICRILEINKVSVEDKPFALLFYNSSVSFINNIKRTAKRHQYILTPNGLFSKKNKRITGIKTEHDIFRLLEIKYIPPIDRI